MKRKFREQKFQFANTLPDFCAKHKCTYLLTYLLTYLHRQRMCVRVVTSDVTKLVKILTLKIRPCEKRHLFS